MLPALAGAQLFWPVTPGAAEDAAQGGLRPDTIPGPEGQVLYPAFSAQEQIPADYGARFTFLHLPFSELCRAALGDPRFAGLVLDPFTAKLFLPDAGALAPASILSPGSLSPLSFPCKSAIVNFANAFYPSF